MCIHMILVVLYHAYIYIYIYIHACIHTYIHTYIHTCIQTLNAFGSLMWTCTKAVMENQGIEKGLLVVGPVGQNRLT